MFQLALTPMDRWNVANETNVFDVPLSAFALACFTSSMEPILQRERAGWEPILGLPSLSTSWTRTFFFILCEFYDAPEVRPFFSGCF